MNRRGDPEEFRRPTKPAGVHLGAGRQDVGDRGGHKFGGIPFFNNIDLVRVSDGHRETLYTGTVGAFFWSPDGSQLLIAAPDVDSGDWRWQVVNRANRQVREIALFFPNQEFAMLAQSFDQYEQSHNLWRPTRAISSTSAIQAVATRAFRRRSGSLTSRPRRYDDRRLGSSDQTFGSSTPRGSNDEDAPRYSVLDAASLACFHRVAPTDRADRDAVGDARLA